MSRCSQEKVTMKSSNTGHLTDSTKEKMKHASIFIKDKEEVVNKRWEMPFERAHFLCTTFILLCTYKTIYEMLGLRSLDPESDLLKDGQGHEVYKKLYGDVYMTFDMGNDSTFIRSDTITRIQAVLMILAAMVFMVSMVHILDMLGVCCNNLARRREKYFILNILVAVIIYCPITLHVITDCRLANCENKREDQDQEWTETQLANCENKREDQDQEWTETKLATYEKNRYLFMMITLIAIFVLFTIAQYFTENHFDKKRGEEEKREKREERKTTEFFLTMIVMILACWSFYILVVFGLPNKPTI